MTENYIKAAQALATLIHKGQIRRDGSPYIIHPRDVADSVDDRLKPIAWLHDSVEDSIMGDEFTLPILRLFPEYIVDAVLAMTKRPGDDYFNDYLPRVKANPDAIAVKLADMADNSLEGSSTKQRQKYKRATAYLLAK